MNTITYYEVTYNSDQTEGKGFTKNTGIAFSTEEQAIAFVESEHYRDYAVMGVTPKKGYSKFNTVQRTATVFVDIHEYTENTKEIEKNNVLRKVKDSLTPQEYSILQESFKG